MAEIKKTTLRFYLENAQDKEIWNTIQDHKNMNEYIKNLIQAAIRQQEQQSVLEEIREIKRMIECLNREGMSWMASMEVPSHVQQLNGSYMVTDPKEDIQKGKTESVMGNVGPETGTKTEMQISDVEQQYTIDADVMNFLDNL